MIKKIFSLKFKKQIMKILKLFPVAFAAFALASCSNDELFSLGAEEQGQKDPNHLYVSVEEL